MAFRIQSPLWRGVATVCALAALVYAVAAVWRGARQSASGDRDEVTIVCTKCGAEATMSSAALAKLPTDNETAMYGCPKCNALAAVPTPYRCPQCKRAFPPPPMNAPMECPLCKAPL